MLNTNSPVSSTFRSVSFFRFVRVPDTENITDRRISGDGIGEGVWRQVDRAIEAACRHPGNGAWRDDADHQPVSVAELEIFGADLLVLAHRYPHVVLAVRWHQTTSQYRADILAWRRRARCRAVCPGRRRPSARRYPLIPLMTMPRMKYRCVAKNSISTGKVTTRLAAISSWSRGSCESFGKVWKYRSPNASVKLFLLFR